MKVRKNVIDLETPSHGFVWGNMRGKNNPKDGTTQSKGKDMEREEAFKYQRHYKHPNYMDENMEIQ